MPRPESACSARSSTIAPTIDARKLADWPEWYQPAALPAAVAMTDPAMPMTAVTIRPVGGQPGDEADDQPDDDGLDDPHTEQRSPLRPASRPDGGDGRRLRQRPHDDAV